MSISNPSSAESRENLAKAIIECEASIDKLLAGLASSRENVLKFKTRKDRPVKETEKRQ